MLSTIETASQDFIVANHFLEHCENPIGTIENHLGKLRPGGILFYAVPDKRFTFDYPRDVTPLEHMIADYEHGPEASRSTHFDDSARMVEYKPTRRPSRPSPALATSSAGHSIHMHVWTQAEFLQLILAARQRFGDAFEIEAAARQQIEFIVVLRKNGPLPAPHESAALPGPAAAFIPTVTKLRRRARSMVRHARGLARRELLAGSPAVESSA